MLTPFGVTMLQKVEPVLPNVAGYSQTGTQTVGPDPDKDED
jgi:hypothetical protein